MNLVERSIPTTLAQDPLFLDKNFDWNEKFAHWNPTFDY